MMRIIAISLVSVLLLAPGMASAATSDWLSPAKAVQLSKQVRQKGGVVTGVTCKDSGKPGKVDQMALVKVSYNASAGGKVHSLSIGDKTYHQRMSSQHSSWKRVAYSTFQRASGLSVHCAVWQR